MRFMIGGYVDEARAFRDWLLRAIAGDPADLQIMYSIDGARRLTEFELDWLPGYEGSKPVRVGNAASGQFQLDVYGEVMSAICGGAPAGHAGSRERAGAPPRMLIAFLEDAWQRPDDGIWEVRGGRRHFTHSKVMAWVAVDRLVRGHQELGFGGDEGQKMLPHLGALRERIHAEVCERGFNPRVGAFTQSYGSEQLDASVLVIPHFGFLPGSDPRVGGTVAAIEKDLLRDGFVLRYGTEHGTDGLPGSEGAFLACSFWLADNYAFVGRLARRRGAVRAAARAAQPPRPARRGVRAQAAAPDRQLPAGVLAPGAGHLGADHRERCRSSARSTSRRAGTARLPTYH